MRLLLLEDDQRLCGAFARSLRAAGHAVDEVHTLFAADEAANRVDFDCLVLDRKVPGGDGMELVRRVRKEGGDVPILVLSAMAEVEDRLEGLEGGADDYLTKPVELRELVLRVSKLARGGLQRSRSTLVRVGRVTMDRSLRETRVDDAPVALTPTQFGVLEYLLANRERVVPTQELLRHVWDRNADPTSNAVHSQITRLRAIFEGVLAVRRVREAGYVVEPEPGISET